VIKPPKLLELNGPLFMSYPAISHVQYRLIEDGGKTLMKFAHRAIGLIDPEHAKGVHAGLAEDHRRHHRHRRATQERLIDRTHENQSKRNANQKETTSCTQRNHSITRSSHRTNGSRLAKRTWRRRKELTRARDELSRRRRELPWVKVEKNYVFDTPTGKRALADLFEGRSQLVVYHFMFAPEWTQGCKSCSLLADHYNPATVHLEHRDVSMVTVSKAPLEKITTVQAADGLDVQLGLVARLRLQPRLPGDVHPEELESGTATYNFGNKPYPIVELPGISVFL
jgi:predicted dithiol-disulfide oxidoreductase (DUF899 family)